MRGAILLLLVSCAPVSEYEYGHAKAKWFLKYEMYKQACEQQGGFIVRESNGDGLQFRDRYYCAAFR